MAVVACSQMLWSMQWRRRTIYHVPCTIQRIRSVLTGEYHSVPGAGREVVRSCVARFCIRAHASHHHNNNISRQEVPRGEGVEGQRGDITQFTLLHPSTTLPPFLSPIISSTHRRTDTHPPKSTLFRYESNNPDSLSRNPQETTRINTNTSYLIHDVHEIRHHRPLRARRHCQPGCWTDSERYGC
jgi:hypothetical protein